MPEDRQSESPPTGRALSVSGALIARAGIVAAEIAREIEQSAMLIAKARDAVELLHCRPPALICADPSPRMMPRTDALASLTPPAISGAADASVGKKPLVYSGFFWDDRHQGVTFHFTSCDLIQAITIAYKFLLEVSIWDIRYKSFLLDRLQSWDGGGLQMTTLEEGKLTIFSAPLEAVVTTIRAAREN